MYVPLFVTARKEPTCPANTFYSLVENHQSVSTIPPLNIGIFEIFDCSAV